MLIGELSRTILASVDERDVLLYRVLDPTLPTPSHLPARAMDVTQISPPSASRLAVSTTPVSTTCQRLGCRSASYPHQ